MRPMPATPRSSQLQFTRARKSMIWLSRMFAMRIISPRPPLNGATTMWLLKRIAAVGREKRAKRRPVISAWLMSAVSDSANITACAGNPTGVMSP